MIVFLVYVYSIVSLVQGSNEAVPIWYIMDEFGSRIQHSEEPSVKIVPFYFGPTQITFSVMWPLRDLEEGGKNALSSFFLLSLLPFLKVKNAGHIH